MIHINDIFSLNVLLIACCFLLFIIFMDINMIKDNKKIFFFYQMIYEKLNNL